MPSFNFCIECAGWRNVMRLSKWLATGAAILGAGSSPGQAQMSGMCAVGADNRFVPNFDIRPSLVVNSDAVLDATRGQLGLAGEQNERAFSFRHTIAAILDSVPPEVSGGPSDAADQEAFVQ